MLTLTIKEPDQWDDDAQRFIIDPGVELELEHSLVSLSKWESFYEKPFMGTSKTPEESLRYAEFMCLTPGIPPEVFQKLSNEHIEAINKYVDAKMSATWFTDPPAKKGRKEVVTAEIVEYWMISLNIPFECRTWHLNRLLSLIKVCNQKNDPPKNKMSKVDAMAERNRLNAERKAKANSTG